MNILIRNQRAPTLTLLTMAVSLALFGCSDNDNSLNDDDIDTPAATYEANIQRTQFGIPHITAKDYKGLGYGVGYAFAEDNICSLAHEIVVASGQSMLYLGDEGNMASDVFYTWYNSPERRSSFLAAQDPEVIDAVTGYAAGYRLSA
ncbi:penicillin acylase family protein [Psychrobacter okhotskensis]|uniref:penicillin acylase family protein n=1 Tax=Psychrobacter okhotskensis TaxID=212403 RepID=UPI001D0F5580|nr:penicillin acylase family protein [Psychrobacter okhotskensis]